MAMSKKDFEAIAAIIAADVKASTQLCVDDAEEQGVVWQAAQGALDTAEYIARSIADHCARANPNFNRDRFLAACGVTE